MATAPAILVRVGRYGTYLQRGEARANVPAQIAPDESTPERALELFQAPHEDRVLGADPDSGLPVIDRAGRFGAYVQVGEANGTAKTKPKTASLLASMRLETVTLDDALNVFLSARFIPGDVVNQMVASDNSLFGVDREALLLELGLDVPVHVQYGRWLEGILLRAPSATHGSEIGR